MKLRLQVAHLTPGRARVRLPEHRGDHEFFGCMVQSIQESGLVHSVRANPVTGSIVLEFDGLPDDLLAKLSALWPIEIVPSAPASLPGPLPTGVASPFKLVSGRDINPLVMTGTLFSAIGVVQALRGRFLVPALSAFWYAADAFRMGRDQTKGSAADQARRG